MGFDFDFFVFKVGLDILKEFNVFYVLDIILVYCILKYMMKVVDEVVGKGIKVIIVVVGGVVYLLGMIFFEMLLLVIGVLVKVMYLDGIDSLLSIVQMLVCILFFE